MTKYRATYDCEVPSPQSLGRSSPTIYDFTLAEPYPPVVALEPPTLPEPLADRIERIAREWGHDFGAGRRTTYELQIELLEIADEVREQMAELTILQRPKRTAMASWRRMIRAMKR